MGYQDAFHWADSISLAFNCDWWHYSLFIFLIMLWNMGPSQQPVLEESPGKCNLMFKCWHMKSVGTHWYWFWMIVTNLIFGFSFLHPGNHLVTVYVLARFQKLELYNRATGWKQTNKHTNKQTNTQTNRAPELQMYLFPPFFCHFCAGNLRNYPFISWFGLFF